MKIENDTLIIGKKAQLKKLLTIFIFGVVLLGGIIYAMSITQILPDGGNNITTSNSSVEISYNISVPVGTLQNTTFNWDGTNYTLYDNSVILVCNMDNRSNLGENNTLINCWNTTGGYNGTVVGDTNISWIANGKHNGAYNFSGNLNYIVLPSIPINASTNMTISFYFNKQASSTNMMLFHHTVGSSNRIAISVGNDQIRAGLYNGTFIGNASSGVLSNNIWYHVVYTWNGSVGVLYINKTKQDGVTIPQTTATSETHIGGRDSFYTNGYLDEFMIFNKPLSDNEILGLDNYFLTKYNSTNYQFYINKSLNTSSYFINSTNPYFVNNYSLCIDNGTEICSSQQNINQILTQKSIIANFSNPFGQIYSNPFGYTVHDNRFTLNYYSVDTNFDNVTDTYGNYTEQANAYLDSGASISRIDASLDTYYNGIENPSFEYWENSTTANNSGNALNRIRGWNVQTSGQNTVTIYRSNDSHSQSYSLGLNYTNGTASFHSYFEDSQDLNFQNNTNYTASIWFKGNASLTLRIQESGGSFLSACTSDVNVNGTWQQFNISCQINTSSTYDYRFAVDGFGTNSYDWLLIDDFSMTKNGSDYAWWYTGANITHLTELIQFFVDNGQRYSVVLGYTPEFLANKSGNCLTSESDYDDDDCPPYNADIFGKVAVDWTNRTTQANTTLMSYMEGEVFNEQDWTFWCDQVSTDNQYKADKYVELYNATDINFNTSLPQVKIIPGGLAFYDSVNMTASVFTNFSDRIENTDNFHEYSNNLDIDIASQIETRLGYCTTYGVSCLYMKVGEFNLAGGGYNQIDEFKTNKYSLLYIWGLRNHPSVLSYLTYQWTESYAYGFGSSEPPSDWASFLETQINGTQIKKSQYNITQLFAKLCSGNGTSYFTLDSDNTSIACISGDTYSLISTNNLSSSQNLSLCMGQDYPYSSAIHYQTGVNYTLTGTNKCTNILSDSYQAGGSNNLIALTSGVAPTITSLTPSNNTYSNNATITFSANLTDDVGLNNATLYIQNATDGSLITQVINYVAGEISIIQNWTVSLIDGVYHWWISLWDDEFQNTISDNQTLTVDTTPPSLSNFQFIAVNSTGSQIGTNSSAFNFSNLQNIETMNITFDLDDINNVTGDIKIFFTANGTNACSLGNNQSTICYNYDSGTWVEYANGTDTNTFRDIGGASQGDYITCTYTGNSTHRSYNCAMDEHYNPNVWKHYPLNFSNSTWESATDTRIYKGTIWKIETDFSNIPLDADYYKLDFRVNASVGLIPTAPILIYACNSTYTVGDPSSASGCELVGSKLPSELQDDGTKFRQVFTKDIASGLFSSLGDVKYFLITSNTPASKYYSMKAYEFLGNNAVRTSISTNSGTTYSNLSDGYETEFNINWFYNSSSNATQILFKIYANDSVNNFANSSIQTLTWGEVAVNLNPIVSINYPDESTVVNGSVNINWTAIDPNGDSFLINVSATNGTYTDTLATNVDSSNNSLIWNTSSLIIGNWNITVSACENLTSQLLCGNDTVLITLTDIINPIINIIYPLNISYETNVTQLNYSITDANPSMCWYSTDNGTTNSSAVSYVTNFTNVISAEGSNTWILYCNDTSGNIGSNSVTFSRNANNPIITILNPTPSSTEAINPVVFKLSLSEIGNCTMGFNGVNYTMSGAGTTSFSYSLSVSDGDHTANFYCSDLTNNQTSSSVFFTFIPLSGTGTTGGGNENTNTGQICVSLSQLNVLIGRWKTGSINLNTLNTYINKWKTRAIC